MAFSKLKISQKLPLLITTMAALSAVTTGYVIMHQSSQASVHMMAEKLVALEESRSLSMTAYLDSIKEDLSTMAYSDYVFQALMDYETAWSTMAVNQTQRLQKFYIDDNPNPAGKKEEMDYAKDGSQYSAVHAAYHPWFRHFLRKREYYDIFLFDRDGNIVYTVFKELDFATNVLSGKWKDTDIATVFRAVKEKPEKDFQVFADFKAYAPSNNVPAAFIAQPILDAKGNFVGAIAFQMPIGRINKIMQVSAGLGESGETYVVGTDRFMRSDSRFLKEGEPSSILRTQVTDEAISGAMMNESEDHAAQHQVIKDYRGVDVMSAYGLIEFLGTKWVVLSEVDMEEIMRPINKMKFVAMLTTLGTLIAVMMIGLFASRKISKPIAQMSGAMSELAQENYNVSIPGVERKDEIGSMAAAVQVFKDNGLEAKRLREEQVVNEKRAEEEKKKMMQELADRFDSEIGTTIQSLAVSAEKLQDAARAMEQTANKTTQASASVAGASEETSSNVNTVASATEEMSASAQEISKQVSDVATRASKAAISASNTSKKVLELNELVGNIGVVVYAIKDIAEQTNLLALNATIEAARAGEAGKGFAVVADEVKKLASETGRKTEEIEGRISQIQAATQASVDAMQEIITSISDIDGMSASASAAVEEQNAVISEITRNISEVSQAAQEVASVIGQVQAAASETGQASLMLKGSADDIARLSDGVDIAVQNFLSQVRGG